MYIFSQYSGRLFGTHQKIDRQARTHLKDLLNIDSSFPSSAEIVHFEGVNGPDGIKLKSPSRDEPWHFINPFDEKDTDILKIINGHYKELVRALKAANQSRAAFEAAWLAHALVDGLTPAHHYPYEQKLRELSGGRINSLRTSVGKKLLIPGRNRRQQFKNNWKMWGPRGLFTTHMSFEMGIAALAVPMSFKNTCPSKWELRAMREVPLEDWFHDLAKEIASLDFYDKFVRRGWTAALAAQVRRQLIPIVAKAVTLAWYRAAYDAGLTREV